MSYHLAINLECFESGGALLLNFLLGCRCAVHYAHSHVGVSGGLLPEEYYLQINVQVNENAYKMKSETTQNFKNRLRGSICQINSISTAVM